MVPTTYADYSQKDPKTESFTMPDFFLNIKSTYVECATLIESSMVHAEKAQLLQS